MPTGFDAAVGTGGALTGAMVLAAVRRALMDPDGVRWPDVVLVRYLNDGVRALKRRRPDAFLQSGDATGTVEELTVAAVVAQNRALAVGPEWRAALAAYVEWQCRLEDEDDPASLAKAQAAAERWKEEV